VSEKQTGNVEVPGGRLYYEAEGEGPPLTLIHAGVAHLRMWDAQVEAWRDRFRVIRYDTRGFGRTITEDVPYSNRADLAAVLDSQGSIRPTSSGCPGARSSRSTSPSSSLSASTRSSGSPVECAASTSRIRE
jgi:hypothetical protein